MMEIRDQVVLVTGSSRGLGLAIARAFHAEGAKVVINYFSESSERVANEVGEEMDALVYRADVRDKEEVERLFQNVEKVLNQPITTIVNSALVGGFQFNGDKRTKLEDMTSTDFETQIQGHVKAALHTTQAAIAGFKELRFGRIINIGSNLVHNPVVPYQDYVTAKSALLGFTRSSAVELGPIGVTVNIVSGGLLKTTDASSATPENFFQMIEDATPLRKITTPEDVAGAVLFFASSWAKGVTGQELVVDGGLVMR